MHATEFDGNRDVRSRTDVFQIEIDEDLSTRQEHGVSDGDSVLRSLSPLLNSMRPFGLYFTRKPRVAPETVSQRSRNGIRGCRSWNPARIYATIMLVVSWLNTVRFLAVFDGNETLGADLFTKLGIISNAFLAGILHTAYYVASHTGSLDRVFRQAGLSASDFTSKCSRRAIVLTVICWALVAWNSISYIYNLVVTEGQLVLQLINTFHLSKLSINIIAAVSTVLQVLFMASWTFPQTMKYTQHALFSTSSFSLFKSH